MAGSRSEGALDVGLLCHGWHPDVGGVESHARDLARELGELGHRVHVLCLDTGEGREPYSVSTSEVEGVLVRRMAYRYHDHRALADLVENHRAQDVVLAWLAETPSDVVHVQHPTGFGMGALRCIHEIGSPLVATLHDYWPLCPRGQMLHADGTLTRAPEPARCAACLRETWPHLLPSAGGEARGPGGREIASDEDAAAARTAFALECLALPHVLLTPSRAARDVYARAGLDPARIEVCENGIDVDELRRETARLRAADRRPPERDGELRLGVLGTVLPSKGALELARALVAADAPGLVLEVHGHLPSYHGDASYVEELRRLAAREPRVRVHGPFAHDELPAILARLDGVAAPSRWEEVYGLTVREARAAGLPVLVSDAGDLPAVTAGGRAGLVVPRDDPDAWVLALRRFASDAAARAAWSACDAPVRGAREMALQVEDAYRRAIRSALAPRAGAAGAGRSGGLLRRLLGRWSGGR
jgi:glycosyltransferase involved in cell wall biosynthesis